MTRENHPQMSEWAEVKEGYRTKTIKVGDCTVIMHRPILSDQEREKRERTVETALATIK